MNEGCVVDFDCVVFSQLVNQVIDDGMWGYMVLLEVCGFINDIMSGKVLFMVESVIMIDSWFSVLQCVVCC